MKNLADISSADLRRAADIREQVDKLAHELHVIFGISDEKPAPVVRQPRLTIKRRKMSAEAKAKISAAAKKRWKKVWAKGKTSL